MRDDGIGTDKSPAGCLKTRLQYSITAQAMRAVSFGNATATTRLGRRRRSPITHGSALVAFERSRLTLAPFPLTAEELVENAAAIGPEHQHHTHQRASGHHTRRHRQGELFGEPRFPSLE
jgi:hypothetical protein